MKIRLGDAPWLIIEQEGETAATLLPQSKICNRSVWTLSDLLEMCTLVCRSCLCRGLRVGLRFEKLRPDRWHQQIRD